jgi:hypothetical protein
MQLILLILANDTEMYLKMQERWRSYMNSCNNIKSFFIKYDENLQEDIVLVDDTIYMKGVESYIPGCLDKTVKSIEYCLHNYNFDFIFRTNMSSVVDLNKLYDLLNHNIGYSGIIGDYFGEQYVSGAGILISKNNCEMLINNKNSLDYNVIDDVSIGKFFTNNNIIPMPLTRLEGYNYEKCVHAITYKTIKDYYHFRCKCDSDSNKTLEIMDKIIRLIYYKMDVITETYHLLCRNECPGSYSIDIMEHLPTLYNYSKECDSVFETGVRGCVSSWAFLCGLLNGTKNRKCLFMNDANVCDVEELVNVSKGFDIDIKYEWKNNLLLEFEQNYDITFIDTWHVYGQLKRELAKFSKNTNKYIIMHDTTVDEIYGETIRCGWDANQQSIESGFSVEEINNGLWPAVVEFLEENPEWYLKERFTNNHGLTILARK